MISASIDLKGIKDAKHLITVMGRSGPFITSHMITQLLPKVRKYFGSRAKRTLDKGATAFTAKTALRYDKPKLKMGNRGTLYWTKDAFYMEEVIRGGKKNARNRIIPEPDTRNFRLDKHGNIPKNFQQQVSVRHRNKPRSVQRAKLRAKYQNSSKKNIIPTGSDRRFKNIFYQDKPIRAKWPAGIYRRDRNGRLKVLIAYKTRSRQQDQKWDATKDGIKYVSNNLNNQFRKSFGYWQQRELRYQMRRR